MRKVIVDTWRFRVREARRDRTLRCPGEKTSRLFLGNSKEPRRSGMRNIKVSLPFSAEPDLEAQQLWDDLMLKQRRSARGYFWMR